MKFIDEYRDLSLIGKLTGQIREIAGGSYIFMEVCGGHTAAIRRFGIPSLLPESIKLLSGPGCPVCVTGKDFIDKAVLYAGMQNTIIATFGDLIRVPGTISSLERKKAEGADIRIVFSGLEALNMAERNPGKTVIFPAIGFETTAPGTAVTIREAKKNKISNFLVLCAHKIMPPAMDMVAREGARFNGFICPGHVAAVTGPEIFRFLPEKYKLGCVISGFEPADILQAVLMLVRQVNRGEAEVETAYTRAVKPGGNRAAKRFVNEVFEECDTVWRGFGLLKGSGLRLRKEFEQHDAERVRPVETGQSADNGMCLCGEILRGLKRPDECSLFATSCTPEDPAGACMVSPEGACNTYYKYPPDE